MSAGLNLPFDAIATVGLFSLRASGQKSNVLPGSVVTSDNPAILAELGSDGSSMILTATKKFDPNTPITANISLAPPPGSSIPTDVTVVTLVDDAVVSQGADTANATFALNPNPPTT